MGASFLGWPYLTDALGGAGLGVSLGARFCCPRTLPHVALRATVGRMAYGISPNVQETAAAWSQRLQAALADGDIIACTACGGLTPASETVRDEEQVQWLGVRADPYCSDACLDAAAEDAFIHESTRGTK